MVDVTRPGALSGRVPANKGRRYPSEVLTGGEVRALLAQCSETSSTGLRYRALITVLYRTGLRAAEALALRPTDIDLAAGFIVVLRGKGGRRRMVGIDPDATRVVDRWMTRRAELGFGDDAALFCTLKGTAMPPSQLRALLPRLARRAGITKRVHPHSLRHTHAYELMMEDVPMPIIQRQLGHRSLATTDRYLAHFGAKDLFDAIATRRWEP